MDAQYLPPLSKIIPFESPPQIIISLPVHTAVLRNRPTGALPDMLVGIQISASALYLRPVSRKYGKLSELPPQTIISLPVQMVEPSVLGELIVLIVLQLSVTGLYFAPSLRNS